MAMTSIVIFKTTNYNRFKTLMGNRVVTQQRVEKIKSSISKVGYIINPIIVNEKMEVIDGQGRLQALKEMGLPVYYLVQQGIGVKECIAMNINQTDWTTLDYIKSYTDRGVEDYVKLTELISRFGWFILTKTLITIAANKVNVGIKYIKDGAFKFTCPDHIANQECAYLMRLKPIRKYIGGNLDNFMSCMLFCFRNPEIDGERMMKKLLQYPQRIGSFTTISECLGQIEPIYNDRISRGQKRYFKPLYEEYVNSYLEDNPGLIKSRKCNPTYRANRK